MKRCEPYESQTYWGKDVRGDEDVYFGDGGVDKMLAYCIYICLDKQVYLI